MSDGPGELLVFSDDWGRHPSSCQYLVRELLPSYRVVWVNTIGTRRPRLDRLTLTRGWEKVRGWTRPGEERREGGNPTVVDPVMWPGFGSRAARALNRRLLERAAGRALRAPASAIGVTTVPLIADLVGSLRLRRWVYYCVDDLARWPGLDRQALEAMERDLVRRADAVVAVSENLVRRIAGLGRQAALLTHGVDPPRWRQAGPAPSAVAGLEPPLVVFWGVVDRRLDTGWLEALSRRLAPGTIVLAGPPNHPDPRLDELPNLVRTGPLPVDELPGLAAAAAALVMPYGDSAATRAIQPLKLKEYLATGRPVVVSDLPANREWSDACDVADAAGSFADLVVERLGGGLPAGQESARRRLAEETWSRKAETFERLLRGGEA